MTLGALHKLFYCTMTRKDTYERVPTGMDFQQCLCKTGLPLLRIPNRLCLTTRLPAAPWPADGVELTRWQPQNKTGTEIKVNHMEAEQFTRERCKHEVLTAASAAVQAQEGGAAPVPSVGTADAGARDRRAAQRSLLCFIIFNLGKGFK